MQNNRNRSDFADAHTDFSTDAVALLKYLIMKNYRSVYLYIYRLAEYADRQPSGKKINWSSNQRIIIYYADNINN